MEPETKNLIDQRKKDKKQNEPFFNGKIKTYFSFFSYTKLGIFNVGIILI